MNNKEMFEKGILTVMGAGIGNKFGMLLPALSFLGVLMVIDYVSGMLAAKKNHSKIQMIVDLVGVVKEVYWEFIKS